MSGTLHTRPCCVTHVLIRVKPTRNTLCNTGHNTKMLHKEVTHVKHNQSSVTPDLTHCVILLCWAPGSEKQDDRRFGRSCVMPAASSRSWWRSTPRLYRCSVCPHAPSRRCAWRCATPWDTRSTCRGSDDLHTLGAVPTKLLYSRHQAAEGGKQGNQGDISGTSEYGVRFTHMA